MKRDELVRKEEIGREMFRKEEIRREVIRENFPVHVTGKFFPYKKNISFKRTIRW